MSRDISMCVFVMAESSSLTVALPYAAAIDARIMWHSGDCLPITAWGHSGKWNSHIGLHITSYIFPMRMYFYIVHTIHCMDKNMFRLALSKFASKHLNHAWTDKILCEAEIWALRFVGPATDFEMLRLTGVDASCD